MGEFVKPFLKFRVEFETENGYVYAGATYYPREQWMVPVRCNMLIGRVRNEEFSNNELWANL
jgi:hypothetical protein